MNAFWGNVQTTTDLWLNRTVPRLDLVKEIHSHLEDLEKAVGALENWRPNGREPISDDAKKIFGAMVSGCSQEPSFNDLLKALDKTTKRTENVLCGDMTRTMIRVED